MSAAMVEVCRLGLLIVAVSINVSPTFVVEVNGGASGDFLADFDVLSGSCGSGAAVGDRSGGCAAAIGGFDGGVGWFGGREAVISDSDGGFGWFGGCGAAVSGFDGGNGRFGGCGAAIGGFGGGVG